MIIRINAMHNRSGKTVSWDCYEHDNSKSAEDAILDISNLIVGNTHIWFDGPKNSKIIIKIEDFSDFQIFKIE